MHEVVNAKKKKKRHQRQKEALHMDQDDSFYFIAGYTSGGAPYGVTWEDMGMLPWEIEEDPDKELPFQD